MSDTLHYVSYLPESLWEAMIQAYVDQGGDVLYPGDEKEMLLRGVQAILVSAYAAHDTAAKLRTLRYAVGEYLDLIGETKGVARIEAAKATATATLTVAGSGTITLPAGTKFTKDGTVFFANPEAVVVIGYGSEVTAAFTLECTEGGEFGNGIVAGTVMKPVEASRTFVSAELTGDTTGGRDEETDDDYRERIRLAGLNNATTGPQMAYESKAMAVSTAITDASAIRVADGSVAVYLLLDTELTEAEKAAQIAAVLAALNAEDERPLTDLVTVQEAAQIAYALDVTYRAPDTATQNVIAAIAAAAEEYRDWQNTQIGRAFDPYKLTAMLYNAGATRVTIEETSTVGEGSAEYTEITQAQYLLGTVTLTRDEN